MIGDVPIAALAVGSFAAARLGWAVPPVVVIAIVALGGMSRRPLVVALGVLLAVSALGARAEAGLVGASAGAVDGEAVVVADPERAERGSVRAEVSMGGKRWEARASGAVADDLAPLEVGDRVVLSGAVRPFDEPSGWSRSRHLVGRLRVAEVGEITPAGGLYGLANDLRGLISSGASSMSSDHHGLFTGLVYGDDGNLGPALDADVRASGLTHLAAVSGQNVAFLLAAAAPLLSRLPRWPRWVALVGLLLFFAVLTRLEPSVLRATVMAGIAALAATVGRPATGFRVLGLAVIGLLLVDPLLTWSVGFQLSVAASTGILVLGPRLGARSAVGRAFAITLAAQLAVAPLLILTFGEMALAGAPATMAAAPVAGPVMGWGMTAGALAGVVGEPLATVLHVPTAVALSWIVLVARLGAALPAASPTTSIAVLALVAALVWWAHRRRRPAPVRGER
ncbi:MAG: ComEC/Rec2 family competence protein [Actinomycetota bacterium]|nr:ComEC/Rec2 family competence protein [Actinomycetota bacterium]